MPLLPLLPQRQSLYTNRPLGPEQRQNPKINPILLKSSEKILARWIAWREILLHFVGLGLGPSSFGP